MPSGKDKRPKLIAEKYAVDYYRLPLVTRRWKSWWYYAALVFALATFGGVYLLQRNRVYQAATVSAAHESFGNDCAACHEGAWQTAMRLATFSGAHRSVPDAACRACHQGVDHVPGLVAASDCAACHQEHRPESELTAIADCHCVECHRGLTLPEGIRVSFVKAIETFDAGAAGHPEFALLRESDAVIGERHAARALGVFKQNHWLDRSGLRFNHKYHLNPAGVKAPGREIEKLACADCHLPDDNGRTMKPIVYERHCQRCHPLRLSEGLSALGEAPHGSVDEVYGFLRRAKLSQLNQSAPGNSQPPTITSSPRDAVKTRLPARAALSRQEETQLHLDADRVVFGRETERLCAHCHFVVARGDTWTVLAENPAVVGGAENAATTGDRAIMPDRWLPHAHFDHRSHRAVACSECHAAADSSNTADILLPSIATCRRCHGGTLEMASGRVRGDCVLCHTYHGEAVSSSGVPLEDLFTQFERNFDGSGRHE